jgi:glutamine synthetase
MSLEEYRKDILIAEYIWLDSNKNIRSKTRVLYNLKLETEIDHKIFPEWNYDGSSTGQASGNKSEVIIRPVYVRKSPFRDNGYIVLCNTFYPDGSVLETNCRVKAVSIFNKKLEEEPWYGIEQEFFLISNKTKRPLGFPENGFPNPQGQYYCSNGSENAYGRKILEEHLLNCIKAGIVISGINAEVAPGQWEYQVGPCLGIESGDQLWISRYILIRTAEKYDVSVDFSAKPVKGDWNGSGCHTNYSTRGTRHGSLDKSKTGLDIIHEHMVKLRDKHHQHMSVYGDDNISRMTGKHETADYYKFSYGYGSRGTSIRIGNDIVKKGYGYYEDRRPSSSMDPYLVTSKLFETTCL